MAGAAIGHVLCSTLEGTFVGAAAGMGVMSVRTLMSGVPIEDVRPVMGGCAIGGAVAGAISILDVIKQMHAYDPSF